MSLTDQVLKAWRDASSMVAPESGRTPTESQSHYKRVRTPEGQETVLVSVWEKSDPDLVKQRTKFRQGLKEFVVDYLPLAEKQVALPRKYGVSRVLRSTETRSQGSRVPYHAGFLLDAEWPRPAVTPKEQDSNQKDIHMTMREDTWTILDKLDKMSADHHSKIHALETRTDSKITDLKADFHELRRDTREDIKEMKAIVRGIESTVSHLDDSVAQVRNSVAQVRDSKNNVVIAVVIGSVGIIAAVIYGTWSVLGTLKAFVW